MCAMLRSLNEADLKMLESHLSSQDHDKNGAAAVAAAFDDSNVTEKLDSDAGE